MFQVLLVDDEPSVCSGMKKLIDWNQYGFELSATASDGQEAWELLNVGQYDLVITDLKMPNMDGISLIRKLFDTGFAGHVMILTAYGEFKYAQQAMQYGVRYYLLKPVDKQQMVQHLQNIETALIRSSQQEHPIEQSVKLSTVQQIKNYTKQNYRDNLTLGTVAKTLNFNSNYLGRVFKRSEGLTYNEYLNRVRVHRAKQLLLSTNKKLAEISDEIGYQSLDYFIRCFKRIEGITPTEFRAKQEDHT